MNTLFAEISAWLLALVLAGAMLIAWRIAYWRGSKRPATGTDLPSEKLNDTIAGLLGLLLAFNFSMSLVKHEQRRQMVVDDSNAIGDFYTCASLLSSPVRERLQGVVKRYLEHRLSLSRPGTTLTTLKQQQKTFADLQAQMVQLVDEAVRDGTPVTVPLVNTLNGVTSNHASRLAAVRDRLPPPVILLLSATALFWIALTGRQQGMTGDWNPAATFGFSALVCLVIWVSLDLNQPQRGAITVSVAPLEELHQSMQ